MTYLFVIFFRIRTQVEKWKYRYHANSSNKSNFNNKKKRLRKSLRKRYKRQLRHPHARTPAPESGAYTRYIKTNTYFLRDRRDAKRGK